jgi:hypothetical protein
MLLNPQKYPAKYMVLLIRREIRYKLFPQSHRHIFDKDYRESESTSHMKALEEKSDFQDTGINCLKRKVQMIVVFLLVVGGFTLRSTGFFRRVVGNTASGVSESLSGEF